MTVLSLRAKARWMKTRVGIRDSITRSSPSLRGLGGRSSGTTCRKPSGTIGYTKKAISDGVSASRRQMTSPFEARISKLMKFSGPETTSNGIDTSARLEQAPEATREAARNP